jgi:hypothetical protein
MIRFLAAALMLALSGCSALTPFAAAPLAASPGVVDPGPRVAICYNSLGKTVAELVGTDYRLDDCPVLTPGRATFVCKPAK